MTTSTFRQLDSFVRYTPRVSLLQVYKNKTKKIFHISSDGFTVTLTVRRRFEPEDRSDDWSNSLQLQWQMGIFIMHDCASCSTSTVADGTAVAQKGVNHDIRLHPDEALNMVLHTLILFLIKIYFATTCNHHANASQVLKRLFTPILTAIRTAKRAAWRRSWCKFQRSHFKKTPV